MSGLKNSPFGKRLRATQQDPDEEGPRRSRPRTNPVFGVAPASTPSLDSSRPSASESGGPESPTELHRSNKDYGDRFVPSRDAGDLRTSYNLMEESGPSTPSRNRAIPTESDAAKGTRSRLHSSFSLRRVHLSADQWDWFCPTVFFILCHSLPSTVTLLLPYLPQSLSLALRFSSLPGMTGRVSYYLPRGHEFHFYTLIARFTKAEQCAFNIFSHLG
jgi:hypothetical protein